MRSPFSRRAGLLFIVAFFVLSFSCSAQVQQAWVARYNNGITNGQHQALKMALDAQGNILLTGFSQNTNGGTGYATLKYAPSGAQLWVARLDSTNVSTASPTSFALDGTGEPAITGNGGTVKYDRNGNQLWLDPYLGAAIAEDAAGNSFITGLGTNFNTIKLSPGGTNLWMATYQDVGPTVGQMVAVDQNDDVVVAGSDIDVYYSNGNGATYPAGQLLVMKFNSNGVAVWSQGMGAGTGVTGGQADAMQLDAQGNIYVDFSTTASSFTTCKIATSNGKLVWTAYDPTDNGYSMVQGLTLDRANNVYVTGRNYFSSVPNCTYATYKIGMNGIYWPSRNELKVFRVQGGTG